MTVKRSLSIRGHRTSITIEEPFWLRLNAVAGHRAISVAELVAEIDETRDPSVNLSSAVRVFLFEDLLARSERASEL